MAPSNPLPEPAQVLVNADEEEVLAAEQLITVTLGDCKHCDSPVATALAYKTSLAATVIPLMLQVLPEVAVVVPAETPFLYNVIVAV